MTLPVVASTTVFGRRADGHGGLHSTFHREECLRFGPRAEITAQLRHPYAEQLSCDAWQCRQALAALTETSAAREIIGSKKMDKETVVSESAIGKDGFGRSRIDGPISIE